MLKPRKRSDFVANNTLWLFLSSHHNCIITFYTISFKCMAIGSKESLNCWFPWALEVQGKVPMEVLGQHNQNKWTRQKKFPWYQVHTHKWGYLFVQDERNIIKHQSSARHCAGHWSKAKMVLLMEWLYYSLPSKKVYLVH